MIESRPSILSNIYLKYGSLFCRPCDTKMAGCVNPSECDTEQSPKTRPLHSAAMLPPCRVWNEKSSGFHYGANTCEACKVYTDKE